MCVCVHAGLCLRARRRWQSPWDWPHAWLQTAWHRHWELSSGPLQEQHLQLNTKPLSSSFFLNKKFTNDKEEHNSRSVRVLLYTGSSEEALQGSETMGSLILLWIRVLVAYWAGEREGVGHRALSYSRALSASWLLCHGALTAPKPWAEHVTPLSSSPRCLGYSDKGFLIKVI